LRKPEWLKVRLGGGANYARIKGLREGLGLATVCEEARCPNIGECWNAGTATFMLLGDTCTRACRFCNVKTGNPGGVVDGGEPERVAEAIATMGLSYVVFTMVDRDDLADGGANHVARCVEATRERSPNLLVEVLTGDFRAQRAPLATVAASSASVLAHNVETVRSITRRVRDGKSSYDNTLAALALYKELAPTKLTKSSLMLGLGESPAEVRETLRDLRKVNVDILTLGQYLQPTSWHLPVSEFVTPERFEEWRAEAMHLGFLFVAAGPLVRSSYRAGELFTERWLRDHAAGSSGVSV
jgi:lipoic acid synthetase